MVKVLFNNQPVMCLGHNITLNDIRTAVHDHIGLPLENFYLVANGKRLVEENVDVFENIHVCTRLLGGKGGFGSMLRAIGAQIEKTTNREACRDLSGRRLRDINEEKRLKKWIEAQAEREKEAEDRKQKKLERLCQQPKHEFKDANYDKERMALPEKVVDAVEQGLKVGSKRKEPPAKAVTKKKPKLWVDADVDDELSSSDEVSSEDENCEKNKTDLGASCSSSSNDAGQSNAPQHENKSNSGASLCKINESILFDKKNDTIDIQSEHSSGNEKNLDLIQSVENSISDKSEGSKTNVTVV